LKRSIRALSIRQPHAENILRGRKRIEYRSRPTKIIGERVYIYASLRPAEGGEQLPRGVLGWHGENRALHWSSWALQVASAVTATTAAPADAAQPGYSFKLDHRVIFVGECSYTDQSLACFEFKYNLTDPVVRDMALEKTQLSSWTDWFEEIGRAATKVPE
jgi:hypothetical protein